VHPWVEGQLKEGGGEGKKNNLDLDLDLDFDLGKEGGREGRKEGGTEGKEGGRERKKGGLAWNAVGYDVICDVKNCFRILERGEGVASGRTQSLY